LDPLSKIAAPSACRAVLCPIRPPRPFGRQPEIHPMTAMDSSTKSLCTNVTFAMNIPNLNTLLANRSGGVGRGRGRGRRRLPGHGGDDEPGAPTQDEVVQHTDNDASGSRLAAVNLGYLRDDFAKFFCTDTALPKRYPIINRGWQSPIFRHYSHKLLTMPRDLCQDFGH
jgi:hypothetical protein